MQGHERCQWPEGQLTCRLLDAGARLEPLRVSFRIVAHTKLNNGNHPPQTGPRDSPHVCEGKAAELPAVMDSWTKEDILVWIRQDIGLGGVAAALAGASTGRCVALSLLSMQRQHQHHVYAASQYSQLCMCMRMCICMYLAGKVVLPVVPGYPYWFRSRTNCCSQKASVSSYKRHFASGAGLRRNGTSAMDEWPNAGFESTSKYPILLHIMSQIPHLICQVHS